MLYLSLALALALFWGYRKIRAEEKVGQKSSSRQIPSLLDATADQLITGLEREWFTSSDLVNVSQFWILQSSSGVTANSKEGIPWQDERSEFCSPRGYGGESRCMVNRCAIGHGKSSR